MDPPFLAFEEHDFFRHSLSSFLKKEIICQKHTQSECKEKHKPKERFVELDKIRGYVIHGPVFPQTSGHQPQQVSEQYT